MKILLLPGASDSNKEWADSWARVLTERGYDAKAFYYDHWGKEQMFSLEREAEKLSKLDPSWTQGSLIIAKSIGSVLCLFATNKKILAPTRAVFMGFPSDLNGERDATIPMDMRSWLSEYVVPSTIFQNENDPVTSYAAAKKFAESIPNITIMSVPGDTHKYVPDVYLDRVFAIL